MKEPKKIGNKWIQIYLEMHRPQFRLYAGEKHEGEDGKYMRLSFVATFLIGFVGIWFTGLSWWSLLWLPCFIWGYGQTYIALPIKYVKVNSNDEPYDWGFYFFKETINHWKIFDSIWICIGPKVKCFHMPWEYDWYRTSHLRKDDTWEHEYKGLKKDTWNENKWNSILFNESHPYYYTLKNGEVQEVMATIHIKETEWRWKMFRWLPFPRMIRKWIDVEFSDAIGEGRNSWKGGTLGCSETMKKNEEPWETLARMERERKFDR